MGTGFSIEQMLGRIEAHVLRLEEKLDTAQADISNIKADGCAVGKNNKDAIRDLVGWRNRGIVGVISALFVSIGALLGMLFGDK